MRNTLFILCALILLGSGICRAESNFFSSSNWVVSNAGNLPSYDSHPVRVERWYGGPSDLTVVSLTGELIRFINLPADMPSGFGCVHQIAFDWAGNAWLTHRAGVTRYNEKDGSFTHYTGKFPIDSVSFTTPYLEVVMVKDGRLLLGGTGGFASVALDAAGWPIGEWEQKIPRNDYADIRTVYAVASFAGERWAFNSLQILRFKGGQWTSYSNQTVPALKRYVSGAMDKDGNVWVLTSDGVFVDDGLQCVYEMLRFDRATETWQSLPFSDIASYNRAFVDRNDVMWVDGTDSLSMIDLKKSPMAVEGRMRKNSDNGLYAENLYFSLNPVGGVIIAGGGKTFEDTAGLGAYYASVSAVRNPLFVRNPSLVRDQGRFVGAFSLHGRMMSNPSVLSSGNYFQVFRTADGRSNIVRALSLTANPSKRGQ